MRSLILSRQDDPNIGLRMDDHAWAFRDYVRAAAARAHVLLDHRTASGPFHVGVLLENVPDYAFLLAGAALAGATVVGLNATRRGKELEHDIRHTQCAILITEESLSPMLEGLDIGIPPEAIYTIESRRWTDRVAGKAGLGVPPVEVDPASPFLLIFTSGTSGAPKAAICSHQRFVGLAPHIVERRGIGPGDTVYCAMPMFHSNGMMSGWLAAFAGGATLALRRKFSASNFLADVRHYGATHANYVGKTLAYVLATPERADDADNSLRWVYGNEGAEGDLIRFAARFGCQVSDAYGSSEGGVTIFRVPDMPPGSLGRGTPGTVILKPETGAVCVRAVFDDEGRLLNPEEAVGEIARLSRDLDFEGYWNNPAADAAKVRDGTFWTGDLGYMDERDFIYFAGRNTDWMRIDGENLSAVTIEDVLARFPGMGVMSVYGVPDPVVGDQVMMAVTMATGKTFDPDAFSDFVATQPDLSPKAVPRFVRVSDALPLTGSHKISKRDLRREYWLCHDPLWIRDEGRYRAMTEDDRRALDRAFTDRGRSHLLGLV